MRDVIKRKTPEILADAEVFLAELSYELIPSVEKAEKLIRDPKDQPILNAAIVSGIDVILTGDKDFLSLDIDSPKPMTIAQFIKSEGVDL
jgi:predicted nucleic acid-binding protein